MKNTWFAVNLAALILVSFAGAAYFGIKLPEPVFDFVAGAAGRAVITAIFLVIILFNIIAAVSVGFGEKERFIRFKNENGVVTISLKAVEEALAIVAHALPEVEKVTVSLSKKESADAPMEFNAQVVAFDYPNVREVTEKMQMVMKARLEEILRGSEKVGFNVNIDKFTPRKSRTERKEPVVSKSGEKTEASASISGGEFPIKYPIGEEETK